MTKTDAWRRLAVETPEGATLLFDPSKVFYLEVDGHDTLLRTARKRPYRSTSRGWWRPTCRAWARRRRATRGRSSSCRWAGADPTHHLDAS